MDDRSHMPVSQELYGLLQSPSAQAQKLCLHAALQRQRAEQEFTQRQPNGVDFTARMLAHLDLVIDPGDKSVADPIRQVGFWEWYLTKGIADIMRPGMTCVDIGANAGYFSALFASLGAKKVIAVEPHPELARRLRKTAEMNHWPQIQVNECAILDHAGTTKLCISSADNLGGASILGSHGDIIIENIPMMTLDSLLADEEEVHLIKMDAEGSEPRIWQGMQETIARFPNLQILAEAHVNPSLHEWLDNIEANGFILRYVDNEGWFRPLDRSMLSEQMMWDLYLSQT